MKALAVIPGRPNSMHLRDVPVPTIRDVPDGRGVLVKVLRVGVDASFFPSSSAVNPALTIMANALRVGDHLKERLGAAGTPLVAGMG